MQYDQSDIHMALSSISLICSTATQMPLHQLPQISKHLLFALRLLLVVDHGQRRLLLRAVHLVFFSDTNSIHLRVPGPAHDVADVFEVRDLVRAQAHFSAARNTLPCLHVLRNGFTFSGSHCSSEAGGVSSCSGWQFRSDELLHRVRGALRRQALLLHVLFELFGLLVVRTSLQLKPLRRALAAAALLAGAVTGSTRVRVAGGAAGAAFGAAALLFPLLALAL
mmetsp:Transcript_22360/g.42654  ORF Transcript_22360/g.42654 Transcript_22360/m.42654 type:complete len:223 (+) Transcript_22360:350-1018(+)